MSKTTVELWICVDAAGDYGVGKDESAAKEQYETDIGPLADAAGFRCYRLDLSVPPPAPRVLTAEVTEDEDALTLAVA
jgi:hypothetical protein